jgi:hypothetical protein
VVTESVDINSWGCGYRIAIECRTDIGKKPTDILETDWTLQKGAILIAQMDKEYVCPWDRSRMIKTNWY